MKSLKTTIGILLFALCMKAQTVTWNGFFPIYDLTTDTLEIVVSGFPAVIDTNYGLAHICLDITHTYDADLRIQLASPDGTFITLIQSKGGSGNDFTGTCLGLDGTFFSNGVPPFTGLFQPVGDVSAFNNGQNPNGTWLLIITDVANQDTGSVHFVSLGFTNNPPRSSGNNTNTGPTGTYVCASCVCPGGAAGCDLLPDMTSSLKEIVLHHTESPGQLNISNATPNIGYGPIEIYGIDSCFCGTTHVPCGTTCPGGDDIKHVIKQRVYQKVPGTDTLSYYDRLAGLMTYHEEHGHLHVDEWANYSLRSATSNPDPKTWPIIGVGTKQSFCLINLGTCNGNVGECLDNNGDTVLTVPNQNVGFHTGCGLTQGIYPGNYDVYSISLNDPIILDNVCNGTYYIVSITDPNNNFLESDETNNVVAVPITLTQQSPAPSISLTGSSNLCPGDSAVLTASPSSNYTWSTGATTQSITVYAAGTYTVSSDCGSSTSTSSPFVITSNQLNVTADAMPGTPDCNGDPVQLNALAPSGGMQLVPVTFTNNTQVFIPDNNSTGVTSSITVSGINGATLSSNSIVSVKLNLTHTYDGDLAISLIAPSGNTVFLSNRRGGSGNNFINTVFSMAATTLISAGSPPFTGNYKPDGNFALLTGNTNGIWKLKVQDLAGADTGRIQNWSITINNLVPEVFSYSWYSVPAGFTSALPDPVVNPTETTTYYVTVTSSIGGCPGSQSATVTVPDELTITGFSPASGAPGSMIDIFGSGFTNISGVTIAGIAAGGFIVVNSGHIEATVPNGAGIAGPVCVLNSTGCSYCTVTNFSIDQALSLNLKVFIEGFYNGNGTLRASIDPILYPGICDTLTVELHEAGSPHTLAYSAKGIISVFGTSNFIFPGVVAGSSYYIVVKHRNAIETWSSGPVEFTGVVNYDFTTALSQAYGNNLSDLNDGNFAIFSGDISDANSNTTGIQDGIIELQDYYDLVNAVTEFYQGYTSEDLTGDGLVEGSDFSLIENNVSYFISAQRP